VCVEGILVVVTVEATNLDTSVDRPLIIHT